MENKNLIKLIFCIYFTLFYLSCDDRTPVPDEAGDAITADKLELYGDRIIEIPSLEDPTAIEVPFFALPLDNNGIFVSDVQISFEMLDGSPGYLSEATLITDSSAVEQNFNIVPLSHLDTSGTFNFENDAAYLNTVSNKKTIVTTDTIVENIDFFRKDPPESIAQKIICVNLSDISAMGAVPKTYTINLSIYSTIDIN